MHRVSHVFVFVALATLVPTSAQAIIISQKITVPAQELREAGTEFFNIVAEIYRTAASLETAEITDTSSDFARLSARLAAVADRYLEFAQDSQYNVAIDLSKLTDSQREDAERFLRAGSLPSRYIGLGPISLSMPTVASDAFTQTAVFLTALSERLAATSLPSSNLSVSQLESFRALNAAVAYTIDLGALHSLLLSTTE